MMVKNFEDLEIWKSARGLVKEIYRLSSDQRFSKDFRFCDQIRGAAISIMSNIAEGYERSGNQEFIQFLYIAKGSCGEVRSQLYVAFDQSYIAQRNCEELAQAFKRLSIMISNLIDYLKNSGMKGPKYNSSNQPNGSNRSVAPQTNRTI